MRGQQRDEDETRYEDRDRDRREPQQQRGNEMTTSQERTGDWYGYSGELVVVIVAAQPGAGSRWHWEVSGAGRPHG